MNVSAARYCTNLSAVCGDHCGVGDCSTGLAALARVDPVRLYVEYVALAEAPEPVPSPQRGIWELYAVYFAVVGGLIALVGLVCCVRLLRKRRTRSGQGSPGGKSRTGISMVAASG